MAIISPKRLSAILLFPRTLWVRVFDSLALHDASGVLLLEDDSSKLLSEN